MSTQLEELVWIRNACLSGEARAIRVDAKITQGEIAADVDVAPPTIQRWEGGMRSPRGEAAVRYAAVLRRLQRALER